MGVIAVCIRSLYNSWEPIRSLDLSHPFYNYRLYDGNLSLRQKRINYDKGHVILIQNCTAETIDIFVSHENNQIRYSIEIKLNGSSTGKRLLKST